MITRIAYKTCYVGLSPSEYHSVSAEWLSWGTSCKNRRKKVQNGETFVWVLELVLFMESMDAFSPRLNNIPYSTAQSLLLGLRTGFMLYIYVLKLFLGFKFSPICLLTRPFQKKPLNNGSINITCRLQSKSAPPPPILPDIHTPD